MLVSGFGFGLLFAVFVGVMLVVVVFLRFCCLTCVLCIHWWAGCVCFGVWMFVDFAVSFERLPWLLLWVILFCGCLTLLALVVVDILGLAVAGLACGVCGW